MKKTIHIGRSPSCDIQINENYDGVSRNHASVTVEGNCFILRDTSTNGSYVNGRKINHERIEIQPGDEIYLGKDYQLRWEKISSFFSEDRVNHRASRETERHIKPRRVEYLEPISNHPLPNNNRLDSREELERELRKWNWGAFGLYPLWGFANGMWWLIFLGIIGSWLFPFVNILLGIKGSQWAWENKEWRNLEHLKQVQESWKPWGIAVTVLNVLSFLFLIGSMM